MPFFRKSAIGIRVSDRSIEAVLIMRRRDRYALISYGRCGLASGAVENGVIVRQEEVSLAVRKLLTDQMSPSLPHRATRAVFAVPESQVYSHVFEVPRLADETGLARTLALEANGFFPYGHRERASAHVVIAHRPDTKDIFYAATTRETLRGYVSVFRAAGLEAVAAEGESAAIARSILPAATAEPVAIVDVGARATVLAVFDRNGIQFSESLPTAGDAFTQALSDALDLPFEEAEEIKKAYGLGEGLDKRGRRALSGEVDALAADVRDAVTFYERRSGRAVRRVVLCGGSSLMPGLVGHLSERLSEAERAFQIELADPWREIEIDPKAEESGVRERGLLLAPAIGLALRAAGFRKFPDIDLLGGLRHAGMPEDGQAHGHGRPYWPHVLRIGALVAASLGLAAIAWLAVFLAPSLRPERPGSGTKVPDHVALEVAVALTTDVSEASDVAMLGTVIEVHDTFKTTVPRDAEMADAFAKGRVRLMNAGATPQTLVPRTRLIAENGALFRLDARVVVPAGGSVETSVTADQPGASGDVPPGRFIIPGLSPARQFEITAESHASFAGGRVIVGPPLTSEELDRAVAELLRSAPERLLIKAEEQSVLGSVVLADLLHLGAPKILSAPETGTPVGDYEVEVLVPATALFFDAEEAQLPLTREMAKRLPAGTNFKAVTISDVAYRVESFDPDNRRAQLVVTAVARPWTPEP